MHFPFPHQILVCHSGNLHSITKCIATSQLYSDFEIMVSIINFLITVTVHSIYLNIVCTYVQFNFVDIVRVLFKCNVNLKFKLTSRDNFVQRVAIKNYLGKQLNTFQKMALCQM